MADIIDFKSKATTHRKKIDSNVKNNEMGEIILFSGVRFERDENLKDEIKLSKDGVLLHSKTR